jgi:glycosyltransferase involved in cell wall biosynthesis
MVESPLEGGRCLKICFPFVGDSVGGSHLSALPLIEGLRERPDIEPVVVLHRADGPLTEFLERRSLGYELLPLPGLMSGTSGRIGKAWSMLRAIPRLHAWLRHRAIDVVHTNDARMHLIWGLPSRLAGVATVWHQRTLYGDSVLSRRLIVMASRVVAIAEVVGRSIAEVVPVTPVVVNDPVVRGADPANGSARRRELLEKAAAGDDALVLATFGNLRAIKRPLVFLETAIAVQSRLGRPVVAVVFGEDREGFQEEMECRAAEAGLDGRLLFMGFRHPVEDWMAGCDAVLAPSVWEAFGRTPVEAMLAGVPVVAAAAAGHAEMIRDGENGLLVPRDDAQAMAVAVAGLLNDPEATSAMTARARAWAEETFSPARHVQEMVALYAELGRR